MRVIDPDATPSVNIDWEREYSPHDYPHQPEKYHRTDHFRDRFNTPQRHLSDEVIRRTIVEGRKRESDHGSAAVFDWSRGDGIRWYFVGAYHVDGYRIAVTAWPFAEDHDAAYDSAWLTTEAVTDIIEFNRGNKNYIQFSDEWSDYVQWSKAH